MRASNVEYLAPARFDDLLECFVRVSRIGRTSVTYDVAAYRLPDDELMVTGTQTAVLIDIATRRPVPVPEHAAERVREFEGSDLELEACAAAGRPRTGDHRDVTPLPPWS